LTSQSSISRVSQYCRNARHLQAAGASNSPAATYRFVLRLVLRGFVSDNKHLRPAVATGRPFGPESACEMAGYIAVTAQRRKENGTLPGPLTSPHQVTALAVSRLSSRAARRI